MNIDINTMALLGIAAFNALTAFLAWRTHKSTVSQSNTIALLEKNTNSIKDALVASTAKASRAEGVTAGRLEGRFERTEPDTDNRIIQKETVVERVVEKQKEK